MTNNTPPIFQLVNSINFEKVNLIDKDQNYEKEYTPFIVNRMLSNFSDTVIFANEMNLYPELPKKLQYDFLMNVVRTRKRFKKNHKKSKIDYLDAVKKYYNYGHNEALAILPLLSVEKLEFIKDETTPRSTL